MTIYAIDDEPLLLDALAAAICAAQPDARLRTFARPSQLLEALAAADPQPDAAFLDIALPGMTGLELAWRIKEIAPRTNIVFVTGYSQYALEAYALRPSGYVIKPVSREKIRTELDNLRNPPERTVPDKTIRVQCFGDFEVFVDNVPIAFARAKSKELLAYLVDRRGAKCTAGKLADILWDDGIYNRSRQKQLSAFRSDMIKSLKAAGADGIILGTKDDMVVDPQTFDCDYYMALAGDTAAINSFTGEYMVNYSWAELTTAALTKKFGDL